MRVLLSTYDSRGGVEPYVALAAQLRTLGVEVQVCAPPDCAERLAEVDVPLVPIGPPVRELVHSTKPPLSRRCAETCGGDNGLTIGEARATGPGM
jgi:vancomycin aglycone glucosyltransferase